MTPETRLVTPEAVPLEFELAGIGSRFCALLLDWLVQGAALLAVGFGLAVFSAAGGDGSWVATTVLLLLLFAVVWGYPTAMETLWRGRTLGKAALGLRVMTREGAPVRFRHAAVRAALALVDFWLTSGAAAVLSALLTRDNQRLGDVVAGTVVVRERTGLRAPEPVAFGVPPGLEGFAATLDTAGLTADDYGAVRSFLLRAPTLAPHVRAGLAASLAGPVAARLRAAPPAGLPAEMFLLCVAAAHQRRQAAAAGWAAPGAPPPPAPGPPPPAPGPPPPAPGGDFAPPS